MNCPACGGEIPTDQRFCHLVVCAYCNSAVVLDAQAARVSGKMAVLPSTPSPFYVGGSGTLGGRRFDILGRVRYGYARGYWDEWFCGFEDGAQAWIGEDERNYTLESCEPAGELQVDYATVRPGDPVRIGDITYHIEEKDVAICEGGEGQLPFEVQMDEKTPFLHLVAEDVFATLEYDLDAADRLFRGRRLELAEVDMDFTAEEVGRSGGLAAERQADDDRRQRIVKQDRRSVDIKCSSCASPLPPPHGAARSLTCSHCGKVLDLDLRRVRCPDCDVSVPLVGGRQSRGAVCPHCRGVLDVSREQPELLARLVQGEDDTRPQVPFELGQPCTFEGVDFRVAGHVRYIEQDAWGTYVSDEFLLFNRDAGFRWLILENGHASLSAELEHGPMFEPRGAPRKKGFVFENRTWKVFECGETTAGWVDGELPWVCRVGDKNHYMDALSPPYLLSAEWTESEMEWYRARYVQPDEIAEAFGVPLEQLPARHGVAPHQPYDPTRSRAQALMVVGLFAVLFGALLLLAWAQGGREIGRFEISPQMYGQEYVTPPFEVSRRNALCEARFEADVDNSWVYLDVAVIDDAESVLMDYSAEMAYYHGREGGESWSEGSRRDSKVFKIREPGAYRLLVLGQAGDAPNSGRTVRVTVVEGVQLARFYAVGAVVCALAAAVLLLSRASFESRRWGDDDDDDDD